MIIERYLRPGRGLLAVALSLAFLGLTAPAWAQDKDDDENSGDNDKKEVRVYRSGGEDEDEAGDQPQAMRNRMQRADAKGAYLGVQIQDITRSLMKARDLSTDEGALVNRVENESPADDAGIKRGDVIVELNHQKVGDSSELVDAVRDLEPGAKVDIVVLRDGLRKTFKVEMQKRPHDMMMGMPGMQGHGQDGMDPGQMRELRARMKEMEPEKMNGRMNMRSSDPQVREDMQQLRQELDELKQELQALKQELRKSGRNRSNDRSDD